MKLGKGIEGKSHEEWLRELRFFGLEKSMFRGTISLSTAT